MTSRMVFLAREAARRKFERIAVEFAQLVDVFEEMKITPAAFKPPPAPNERNEAGFIVIYHPLTLLDVEFEYLLAKYREARDRLERLTTAHRVRVARENAPC